VASSWILFFSYQDDARSNTHQTRPFDEPHEFSPPYKLC